MTNAPATAATRHSTRLKPWTLYALLTSVAGLTLQSASPPPDPIEKQFGLKAAPGRELVLAHCLPCHSSAIIAANHLPRVRWAELITRMQTQNGMRPLDNATRDRILDYLQTAQRPDDASLTAGKTTPWATPLYRPNPIW